MYRIPHNIDEFQVTGPFLLFFSSTAIEEASENIVTYGSSVQHRKLNSLCCFQPYGHCLILSHIVHAFYLPVLLQSLGGAVF